MRIWRFCYLLLIFLCKVAIAETVFNLYTTSNYIADDTIKRFESRCNCKLFLNYFSDPQEMAAKLAAGASGYDVIIGTGYALEDINSMNKLAKLDLTKIHNLNNIESKFMHQSFDPTNSFSIPYAYTPVFLAYNKTVLDKLGIIPDSWAVIFDEKYLKRLQGKVTVFDSQRNVFAAALLYLGKDPNSVSKEDLLEARKLIEHASRYWARYDSTTYYRALLNGEIWVAMSYSNDLYNTLADAKKTKLPYQLAGMLQKEGNMVELDNLVITKNSKIKDIDYLFIDTVLEPQSAIALNNETGSSVPNKLALKKISPEIVNTSWIYPGINSKIYGFTAYPPKVRIMANEVWTELKMECHY